MRSNEWSSRTSAPHHTHPTGKMYGGAVGSKTCVGWGMGKPTSYSSSGASAGASSVVVMTAITSLSNMILCRTSSMVTSVPA